MLVTELDADNDFQVKVTQLVDWLVVGSKADRLTRDLGLWVECPPWGVFLRDPGAYLRMFRRKPPKTPNG